MIKTPEEGREIYKDAARMHRRTLAEGGGKLITADHASHHAQMLARSQEKLRYMAMALALSPFEIGQIERELEQEEGAESAFMRGDFQTC